MTNIETGRGGGRLIGANFDTHSVQSPYHVVHPYTVNTFALDLVVCFVYAAQQQQPSLVNAANVYSAVSAPTLFGDERDAIVAKWNQLQSFWGTGRGYFNHQGQYVDFTPDNPFSFFKVCSPDINSQDLAFVSIVK